MPLTDKAVREHQAVVTELSTNASSVTYWVGWHVVTTVDTVIGGRGDAKHHAVVRFSSVLLPGQSQLISVPFANGEQQQVLQIPADARFKFLHSLGWRRRKAVLQRAGGYASCSPASFPISASSRRS